MVVIESPRLHVSMTNGTIHEPTPLSALATVQMSEDIKHRYLDEDIHCAGGAGVAKGDCFAVKASVAYGYNDTSCQLVKFCDCQLVVQYDHDELVFG
jgi:hypothetical protein